MTSLKERLSHYVDLMFLCFILVSYQYIKGSLVVVKPLTKILNICLLYFINILILTLKIWIKTQFWGK